MNRSQLQSGVFYAITAAILFGASTPLSKTLLGQTTPWMLAGLLYLGSGLGLLVIRSLKKPSTEAHLKRLDWLWLSGAILSGGIVAPVLMMFGLAHTQSAVASFFL
jgi:drug/metabolite transporter (DMT)-like permease